MIRKAAAADIDAIAGIYDEILSAEEAGLGSTGWVRGLYPDRSIPEEALKRGDLFVLEEDGVIRASAIINHTQPEEYKKAPWEHEADAEYVFVLHTLTVSPSAYGRGLGRQFVGFFEDYAREHGCSELRLDTNERNLPARCLYRKLGYKEIALVHTVFNGIRHVGMVIMEKYLG